MSERPDNHQDEQPQSSGLWHTPSKQPLWREMAVSPRTTGWRRVSALPEELEDQPKDEGLWHLPAPEDTPFGRGEVIEIAEQGVPGPEAGGRRPEDLLEELLRPVRPGLSRPEDFLLEVPATEVPESLRPEDSEFAPEGVDEEALAEGLDALEALGAEDDDEDAFSMTEYFALADLERGAAESTSMDAIGEGDLSPAAEAAMRQAAIDAAAMLNQTEEPPVTEAGPEDPAAVARRMAQQLASESAEPEPVTEGGPEDPAAVAARMAQQFAGEQEPEGATPVPSSTQPLSPAEARLADQFRQTRAQIAMLREQYQRGEISEDMLQARRRELAILDANNVWWMIGFENDQWYRYDNASGQWLPDDPPVPLDAPRRGAPPTVTGELDPVDVLGGSLPQLRIDEDMPEYSGESYRDDTPVPRPGQPVIDPNATMVGESWDQDMLTGSAPTIQGMRPIEPTIPSRPVTESPGVVESPYDRAAVPEYAWDESRSPVVDDVAQRERASMLRIVLIGVAMLVACGIVTVIGSGLFIANWYTQQIEPYQAQINGLASFEPEFQTARILAANGDEIARLTSRDGGERIKVPLNEISPYLIHAVVSVEDDTFYDNPGFSTQAILRAFVQNLTAGEVESGASTITQQIARRLVLQESEVTAERKLNEILIANRIAEQYDKNFILELYLNEIFFGNQSYGAEAAAEFYFDKPASELDMAESALLAAIISSPAANDPVVNREQAFQAMRNAVRRMINVGCLQFQHAPFDDEPFCIGENVFVSFEGNQVRLLTINADGTYGGLLALQLADVETRAYEPRSFDLQYPHFVNYVQAQVDALFGAGAMFERGFTIRTTLLPRIQETAETALRSRVAQLRQNGVNTGAIMVTDPTTGEIRAMVGSPDFNDAQIAGQVDNTRTWQQPGSAIKAVVYTGAIEGGAAGYMTPASILWDVDSPYSVNGQTYRPVNFGNTPFQGPTPLRIALQNSYNVSAVKALDFIGTEKFREVANRMGLNFLPEAIFGLPSALGANEVRLIDMMKAYGTLANNGVAVPLYTITEITESIDGTQVSVPIPEDRAAQTAQVISQQVAYVMQNILSDDLARREQFPANSELTLAGVGVPVQNYVAAKTGTSSGGRDLWTMGFTHNVVVGVWLGTFDNSETINLSGFTAAAPVFNQVLRESIAGSQYQPRPFTMPVGVVQGTLCQETGTLADDSCPTRVSEIYIQNQPPPPPGQGFVQVLNIDSWTGLVANQWCQENVVTQTYADIDDPFALNWLVNTSEGRAYAQRIGLPANLQAPPTAACSQGQVLPTVRINNPTAGQTLTETVTITGQISAPDFRSYQLLYAPASTPNEFRAITQELTQQFPTAGSALGTWDTRNVPNGSYILRLAAYSTSGGYIFRDVQVTIQNVPPTPTPTPSPTLAPVVTQPPVVITPLPFDTLPPPAFGSPTPTATLAF